MQELTPAYLNGAWHLDDTTGPRPICQNRLPVTALNPGWHAESAYLLTESLIILGIRHDDGRMAAWFLNETYEYITNNASELAPDLNAYLIGMAELALTWTALQQISASSARTDESRREAKFAATLASDQTLLVSVLDRIVPQADSIILEDEVGVQKAASIGALTSIFGKAPDTAALHDFFRLDMLQVQVAAAANGFLDMPCPLSGVLARCDGVWCIDLAAIAFRFTTPNPENSFVVLCMNLQFTAFGVYFPQRNLFLYLNDRGYRETHRFLGTPPERKLWEHVIRYAPELSTKPSTLKPTLLCFYDHVGHHLWNELGGIEKTLAATGPGMPPVILVFPDATEMYGRLEDIFPEVNGKVHRLNSAAAVTRQVYAEGLLPLRPSGIQVSRALANRIRGLAERSYFRGLPERMIGGLRRQGYRTVILGLRTQNRTVVDFRSFCVTLIDMLRDELGRVIVVLDGQNCSESGFRYRVTFQEAAAVSLLDVEMNFAKDLEEEFRNRDDIILLSTIGLPVGASIAIGDQADFFVTPWGAGMAKYRWVNNLPGLALAGPTCARLQPLHLYDDPKFIESPAPMYFMDADDVQDAPEGPRLIASGLDDRINIRVDFLALRLRLRQMILELGLSRGLSQGTDHAGA